MPWVFSREEARREEARVAKIMADMHRASRRDTILVTVGCVIAWVVLTSGTLWLIDEIASAPW